MGINNMLADYGVLPGVRRELLAKAAKFQAGDLGALDKFMKEDMWKAIDQSPHPKWFTRNKRLYFDNLRSQSFTVTYEPFVGSDGIPVMMPQEVWHTPDGMPLPDQPAHFANAYVLPGHEAVLDDTGLWRNITKKIGWNVGGTAKRREFLTAWHKWQQVEDAATTIWRDAILLPRAVAVGTRVGLEESLAVMAFDKASIFNPWKWWGFMRDSYGRELPMQLLGDDPMKALGNMGLTFKPKLIDRGSAFDARDILERPSGKDITGFLERKQTTFLTLLSDHDMVLAAMEKTPEEFADWLKTSTKGKTMSQIIKDGPLGPEASVDDATLAFAKRFQGKVNDAIGGREDVRQALLDGSGLVHRTDVAVTLDGVKQSYAMADDLRAQADAIEGVGPDGLRTRPPQGQRPEQYLDPAGEWQPMPSMARNAERTPEEVASALRREALWVDQETAAEFRKYAMKKTRVPKSGERRIFDERGNMSERNLRSAVEADDLNALSRDFPGWVAKEGVIDMRSPAFKDLMKDWVGRNFDHEGKWTGEVWDTSPIAKGPVNDVAYGANDQRTIRQNAYHYMMSAPNFHLVKYPFYKQLFNEYETAYLGRGMSETMAAEAASKEAAAQYRGGVGIGNLYLLERAHTIESAMKSAGIDWRNPLTVAFMGPLIHWLLPNVDLTMDPKGLNLALQGPFPGLGPVAGLEAAAVAQRFKKLKPVIDTIASHYDISMYPTGVARIIEGLTGRPAPLDYLDGETHDALFASANDQAMRQAYADLNKAGNHAPNFDDPKYLASDKADYNRLLPPTDLAETQSALDAQYRNDTKAYISTLLAKATTLQREWSIYRGVMGLVMPAPVYVITKDQESLNVLYQKLAGVAKGSPEADQLYTAWLAQHPWGEFYLQPKTVWTDPNTPKPVASFTADIPSG